MQTVVWVKGLTCAYHLGICFKQVWCKDQNPSQLFLSLEIAGCHRCFNSRRHVIHSLFFMCVHWLHTRFLLTCSKEKKPRAAMRIVARGLPRLGHHGVARIVAFELFPIGLTHVVTVVCVRQLWSCKQQHSNAQACFNFRVQFGVSFALSVPT